MATPQQPAPNGMQISERPSAPVQATETSSSAVAAREKASVEARFLMALHRPRNPDVARTRLLARCKSPAFAWVAEYSKPIGPKKFATGASIRLMEEIGRQWGNLDTRGDITFDDEERRIVQVSATDLETNYSKGVAVILEKTVERKVPRQGETVISSRVNSRGETTYRIAADEDQFFVKQNASMAKAFREMIRAVVPGDLVEEALDACFRTRKDEDARDPAETRKRIADLFFKLGVMPNQLAEYLDIASLEVITAAQIEVLRALHTAMKEGETTWAEIMADKKPVAQGEVTPQGKGATGLKDALKKKGATTNGGNEGKPASEPPTASSVDSGEVLSDEENAALDAQIIASDEKKG